MCAACVRVSVYHFKPVPDLRFPLLLFSISKSGQPSAGSIIDKSYENSTAVEEMVFDVCNESTGLLLMYLSSLLFTCCSNDCSCLFSLPQIAAAPSPPPALASSAVLVQAAEEPSVEYTVAPLRTGINPVEVSVAAEVVLL